MHVSSSDATPTDGSISTIIPNAPNARDRPGLNFGLNQAPTATPIAGSTLLNPGGTTLAEITNRFGGTDPNGGIITGLKLTSISSNISSISINGVTYTTTAQIEAAYPNGIPTNASGTPTVPVAINPIDGNVTTTISYVVIDNAGLTSTPASFNVAFTTTSISGNVFNDMNGGNVNNSSNSTTIPTGLYANLVDADNKVVQSVLVSATNGTYSFSNVNGGNYTIKLSTTQGNVDQAPPALNILNEWAITGSYVGAPNTGNSNLLNGTTTTIAINQQSAYSNANFGIQRRPESAVHNTTTTYENPGNQNSFQITAFIMH